MRLPPQLGGADGGDDVGEVALRRVLEKHLLRVGARARARAEVRARARVRVRGLEG